MTTLKGDFARSVAEWQKQRLINEMRRVDRLESARVAVEEQLVNSSREVMANLRNSDDQPAALQVCCAVQACLDKAVTVSDKTLKMTLDAVSADAIDYEAETEDRFTELDEGARGRIVDVASAILSATQAQNMETVNVDDNTGEILD